jgi:tetratricopeptide (TPR) repeat protein
MKSILAISFLYSLPLVVGCAAIPRTPIIVPPEAVREWAYNAEGETGEGRYVVRMTDGRREWEVEFPDARYGSEVRVPLKNGGHQIKLAGDRSNLTAADRELQEEARTTREKADPYDLMDQPKPAEKPTKVKKAKTSYLVGVAQIRELYDARNLEIALVQLVELEKEYPNDEKLLSMKGSIYRKMGKNGLARAAWERVLALNPDNTNVAAALRALAEEEDKKEQP